MQGNRLVIRTKSECKGESSRRFVKRNIWKGILCMDENKVIERSVWGKKGLLEGDEHLAKRKQSTTVRSGKS